MQLFMPVSIICIYVYLIEKFILFIYTIYIHINIYTIAYYLSLMNYTLFNTLL